MKGKRCAHCYRQLSYDRDMSVKLGGFMRDGRLIPHHNYYVCPVHGCSELHPPAHREDSDGHEKRDEMQVGCTVAGPTENIRVANELGV